MLEQEDRELIRKKKMEGLVAIELHKQKISELQRLNRLIEFLAMAVPAFYLTPRFLVRGTNLASLVDNIGEVLAAILLALSIGVVA